MEFCEPVSDLQYNLEEEIYDPDSIVEVITTAHKHAMQDEHLGFFMYDRSTVAAPVVEGDNVSDGYDSSIAEGQQPDETPVDPAEGRTLG